MSDLLDHYKAIAGTYDEMWLYSEEYSISLARKIAEALKLNPSDKFIDVGCGTGLYAKKLFDIAQLEKPVLCADPSKEMLKFIPDDPRFIPLLISAQELFESHVLGDKFLVKEVIHHIEDKSNFFNSIAKCLKPQAMVLILLLPPKIEYPLFKAALQRYEKLQPDYRILLTIAEQAGLKTEAWFETVPLKIEKHRYMKMVSGRYMSLLSSFTDAEIQDGLQEIDKRFPNEFLCFNDTFVFIRLRVAERVL